MLRPEDCKPGVLVECIRDTTGLPTVVRKGAIYTIEAVVIGNQDHHGRPKSPALALFLEGVHEACRFSRSGRMSYGIVGFRLLPSSRLDVFRAMLEPKPAAAGTPATEIEHVGVVALEGV